MFLLRKTDGWTRVCDNSIKLKQIVRPRICMERGMSQSVHGKTEILDGP